MGSMALWANHVLKANKSLVASLRGLSASLRAFWVGLRILRVSQGALRASWGMDIDVHIPLNGTSRKILETGV